MANGEYVCHTLESSLTFNCTLLLFKPDYVVRETDLCSINQMQIDWIGNFRSDKSKMNNDHYHLLFIECTQRTTNVDIRVRRRNYKSSHVQFIVPIPHISIHLRAHTHTHIRTHTQSRFRTSSCAPIIVYILGSSICISVTPTTMTFLSWTAIVSLHSWVIRSCMREFVLALAVTLTIDLTDIYSTAATLSSNAQFISRVCFHSFSPLSSPQLLFHLFIPLLLGTETDFKNRFYCELNKLHLQLDTAQMDISVMETNISL